MTIRNALIAAGSAIAFSALAGGAFAANTVNATANASVTVVSATTITKNQDMVFGTVIRPSGANGNTTFAMDTNGNVVAHNGDGSVVSSTTSPAKFTIASQAAITYTLSQTLTFAPAGLINVAPTTAVAQSGTLGQVPANGSQQIAYGGQFDVTPTTTPQTYTGSLAVTVTYN
jgi:hypothetical protein